jgi:hypothetical protein
MTKRDDDGDDDDVEYNGDYGNGGDENDHE